jgi:hypothetical protein
MAMKFDRIQSDTEGGEVPDDFESVITESSDDKDQWGPGGFENPNPSLDGPQYLGVTTDVSGATDRTQNPNTLIPGAMTRQDVKDMQLLYSDAVELEAADVSNFRSFLLDNSVVRLILPYSQYRKFARLDWTGATNAIVIGRQTSLEALVLGTTGITGVPANGLAGTYPLRPLAAGTNTRAYMEYHGKQALYAIGLVTGPSALCPLNVIDYSWNGGVQIG